MNGKVWSGTCLVLAAGWVMVVSAQGPQAAKPESQAIAVRGCIARAPGATTATTASPDAMTTTAFVLSKAEVVPMPGSAATSQKTVANQTKTPAAHEFRLDGTASMLSPYLNEEVQVTGPTEAAAQGGARGSGTSPIVNVQSVLLLNHSCS